MIDKRTPDQIYPKLFEAVLSSHIFEDSKTFVDATPKFDPDIILESFMESRKEKGFELASFVASNFSLPSFEEDHFGSDKQCPVREHIELLWDVLTRTADKEDRNSSLIALPRPYIVPGGRFREIYYWDSYFTMLGLARSGRIELVENMVANFAYLIDQIGFIPNGNRTYFCTRSQPPLFSLMVELLAELKQDQDIFLHFLPQLEIEYAFWMSGSDTLNDELVATRRVLAIDGGYLNRYWDDSDLPRQESFAEDLALATHTDREVADLYRDIRAACESGWDFSSRWLEDNQVLASIRTTQIIPIDLNAILHKLEAVLAKGSALAGNDERASFYESRARQRKEMIQTFFFNEQSGYFCDLLLPNLEHSGKLSLAMAFPLFFNLATPEQAKLVARRIHGEFLKTGGWVTTLNNSGQQWDSPNGWAPLQWVVHAGLRNYGYEMEAEEGAKCWVENNLNVYQSSGKLLEKYDVENIGLIAKGGEYTVQDGFGWTNGVLLGFLDQLGM